MAELLYRLGRACARRARTVLAAWLAVLVLAGAAFVAFGGTLASSFSIPGTPTADVTERLQTALPEASGGTGTIVLTTEDGAPFTPEQEAQVADRFAAAEDVDGVESVVDPFATQTELADQRRQVEDGRTQIAAGREQIEDGRAQLAAGQEQLDAARAQLDAGQEQLDAARAQAEDAGALAQVGPQLDAQQAELDAGRAELDTQAAALEKQVAALEDQSATLEEQSAQLELSAPLLDMAADIRLVSEDGSAAVASVVFSEPNLSIEQETKDALVAVFDEPVDGVRADFSSDIAQGVPQVFGVGEAVGLVVAAVVLVVMLGTLVGAGLPLLTALVGVGVAALVSLAFSGVVEMASLTPVLGLMLGLAVGIDYSLFITSRYRQNLMEGLEAREAAGRAIGTAGSAVVFAGATVVIALAGLSVVGIPFLTAMGLAAAGTVAVAVLVALTLLPAVLAFTGTKILSRRQRAGRGRGAAEGFGFRWGRLLTRMRLPVLLVGVLALGALALPVQDMRLALPDAGTAAEDSPQRKAYDLISEGFGPGFNGRLIAVVNGDTPAAARAAAQQAAGLIGGVEGVQAVAPPQFNRDGTTALVAVIPEGGPSDAVTEDAVHAVRDKVAGVEGAEIALTGVTALGIDISEKPAGVLPVYLLLVVGLSILLLMLVFRSVLVPLKAAARGAHAR